MCMTCHPSGGLLATGGADRKVLVWDVDGGYCTHYFKGHGGVVAIIEYLWSFLRILSLLCFWLVQWLLVAKFSFCWD